jgi:hypothetical protein
MRGRARGALPWLLLAAACGPPEPGRIGGDAFLVEDVGREVNLAGLQVRLVPEEEQLDSTLARFCPTRHVPHPAPPELHRRAWGERQRLLAARVQATATADSKAKFAFARVPPGRYRLWADTTLGDVRWTWLHPVRVMPGDTIQVELSNANPDENPFRCGPRDNGPTPLTTKAP